MGLDEAKKNSYCGVDIHEGKLRLLFAWNNLGTNVGDCLDKPKLAQALNEAPPPAGSAPALSSAARLGIKQNWDPKVDELTKKFETLLGITGFKLNPNFEDTFAKLKASGPKSGLSSDWESRLGKYHLNYFEGVHGKMTNQKFGEDDMLQEVSEELMCHQTTLTSARVSTTQSIRRRLPSVLLIL